ncbi:putative eukaryotic translation initiation factor 5 [Mycena venus]|uniref:Putative eukaryotic translation initiation factor 5 n=1 Tax=Mycena venus TaxID=2733690 RepID=A0A8H6YDG1_9AGAR|nr:putative eukaryotic translation initiation factor 5 [Mycena venus]
MLTMLTTRRQRAVATGCSLFLIFLIWQFVSLNEYPISVASVKLWPSSTKCSATMPLEELEENLIVPQKRYRAAVASSFGFHFDVYLAVVWTLERVMGRSPTGGVVEVYAPAKFGWQFQTIVDTLGLYHGEAKQSKDLVEAINANKGDGGIDLVVLGTCEFDLRKKWSEELLAAWDARDAEHKFKVVCIVHNVRDSTWQQSIPQWSQRNAIRILPIAEHVAAAFKKTFLINADSPNATIRSIGYEDIPVDVHVPVLDVPLAVERSPSRILSNAVIQGSFSTVRRDYLAIFSDLKDSLARDPKVWGYLPLGTEKNASYAVDTTLPDPPFHLHLIGSGSLRIPQELKNVVAVHTKLSYPDFYQLMGSMDICVPGFASGNWYYDAQASSTFAMAVECDVPILVTQRIRNSYTYVDDDKAVVTRPAAMREVEALHALRTRDASDFLDRTGIPWDSYTARAVVDMLRLGWTRDKGEARAVKEKIWRANERVVQRILRDL